MQDYVESQAGMAAVTRFGGDLDTLKRFIAAGFPVVIEKGLQPAPKDWMGHYVLVNGYDDGSQEFLTQDSYTGPGTDVRVPYADLQERWWRDFNNVYLVIYPSDREAEVTALLGPQADQTANYQYAAEKADQETKNLTGRALYFAWYNLGSSRAALGDLPGAAQAFDQAFAVYPQIPADDRPWRMLWYQTAPYEAYYSTGRYQDVIDLGNQTLNLLGNPILEETLYWQGKAREALGDMQRAVNDYRAAYSINPRSTLAEQELRRLGVELP
jgi:hypothetical protein